jgi:hypothetical protein
VLGSGTRKSGPWLCLARWPSLTAGPGSNTRVPVGGCPLGLRGRDVNQDIRKGVGAQEGGFGAFLHPLPVSVTQFPGLRASQEGAALPHKYRPVPAHTTSISVAGHPAWHMSWSP